MTGLDVIVGRAPEAHWPILLRDKQRAHIHCRLKSDAIEVLLQPSLGRGAAYVEEVGQKCPLGVDFTRCGEWCERIICSDHMDQDPLVTVRIQQPLRSRRVAKSIARAAWMISNPLRLLRNNYSSAVVGSITVFISAMRLAGKPPS